MTEMECMKKQDQIAIGDSSASGKHYIPVPMWRPIVDDAEEKEEEDQDIDGNKVIEEEDEIVEESDEVEEIVIKKTNEGVKRKRNNIRESVRKTKKVKLGKQIKNPKDRWSAERYKSAEKSLWEVMKANGAVADNPIMRPALRVEARKKIGDTGLLDHLLKHMAGKVTPCGKDRFRRRHNPEGQMVFWLESADLCSIRKQAGVNDPYWIPPPGWELGDSVTKIPFFM
ncbi:hypothetical protein Leryth_009842 [Lithospermum erythrorhizon]|nr:hypothetical protein Leryth_009842 [Lithospermum erythrorhizon]